MIDNNGIQNILKNENIVKITKGFLARPDTSLDLVFTTCEDGKVWTMFWDFFEEGTCHPTVGWKSVRPTVLFRGNRYSTPYWLLIHDPNWRLQTWQESSVEALNQPPANLHSPREPFKVGTASRFGMDSNHVDKVASVVNHSNLRRHPAFMFPECFL